MIPFMEIICRDDAGNVFVIASTLQLHSVEIWKCTVITDEVVSIKNEKNFGIVCEYLGMCVCMPTKTKLAMVCVEKNFVFYELCAQFWICTRFNTSYGELTEDVFALNVPEEMIGVFIL